MASFATLRSRRLNNDTVELSGVRAGVLLTNRVHWRWLKGLESENAKLKKLLADAMLDNAALKDLLAKKW